MILGLLIGAAVVLAVVAAEIACRLWVRHVAALYVWPPFFHVEMDLDPQVFPSLSPHSRFQVNSLGARGAELPPPGTKTLRILTCGGSGVECFSQDQQETWSSRIEQFLSKPENLQQLGVDQVYVANLGKSGLTTDALCYAFPRILPRFAPLDVLLLMIGMSAVNSWTRAGTPSQLLPPEPPWGDIAWHGEHTWSWKPRRTALCEVALRLKQRIQKPVLVRKALGRGFARSRALRRNAREVRDTFGDPRQWIEHYSVTLAQAVEQARPYARHVVLIRQPWFDKPNPSAEEEAMFWHGSVGDAALEFADIFYSHRVLCALMQLIDDATVRVGEKMGVEVLRPAAVLEPSVETYYDHAHITPAGSRILGDFFGRHILETLAMQKGKFLPQIYADERR